MSDIEYKIKIMQCFSEGAEIEYSDNGGTLWMEAIEPTWNWRCIEYRVKKEKVKMYKYAFKYSHRWEDSMYFYKDDADFLDGDKKSNIDGFKRLDYTMIEIEE